MFYAAWLHDAAALQHLTFDLILLNYPAATLESNHLMLELQTLKNSDIGEEKYPCPPPKKKPTCAVCLARGHPGQWFREWPLAYVCFSC